MLFKNIEPCDYASFICQVPSQLTEDEVSKDNEIDENEMPLGKMLKHIKSQGTSGKKLKKNKSVPAETKMDEHDIDILKLNNLELCTNFEPSIGHEHCLSKKTPKEAENATGQKRKSGETTHVPVPKRRQSSPTHGKLRLSTINSKAPRRVPGEDSLGAKSPLDSEVNLDTASKAMQIKMVKGSDEDLLVSSLKQKVKGYSQYHNDENNKPDELDMKVQPYCNRFIM